jgi:hypothetical protein
MIEVSEFGSGRPKNIWILRIRIRNTGTNNAGIASAAGTPKMTRKKSVRWVSGRENTSNSKSAYATPDTLAEEGRHPQHWR